jgi:hypothetical protein
MADDASEADAAMAAMGLPTNFSAPAFPRAAGRGARPPPPGPSNRGGRGRDAGWSGRGRGQGAGPSPHDRPPAHAPNGPASMRGGQHQRYGNARGGDNKRKRGGSNFQSRPVQEGPLPALKDVREWYKE